MRASCMQARSIRIAGNKAILFFVPRCQTANSIDGALKILVFSRSSRWCRMV